MRWIAPTEKDTASTSLEKRLWDAADQFRANSGLKAQGTQAGESWRMLLGVGVALFDLRSHIDLFE